MSKIVGNKLIITLPGEPAAEVTATAHIPWGIARDAQAVSERTLEDGRAGTNLTLLLDALVRGFAADEDTRGRIRDRAGKEIVPFDPEVLERNASANDVAFIAFELGQRFFPRHFGLPADVLAEIEKAAKEAASAEGNDQEPEGGPAEPPESDFSEDKSSQTSKEQAATGE